MDATIEVSEGALTRIADIANHLDELSRSYRRDESKYLTTAASFANAMTRAFALLARGGRLVADNDCGSLALGVAAPHIYVGVVFFPDAEERIAQVPNNRVVVCTRHGAPWPAAKPATPNQRCPASKGEDDYCGLASDVPMSGTWSLHS